jgi:DNA-binding beta-propeller fold protein YncE
VATYNGKYDSLDEITESTGRIKASFQIPAGVNSVAVDPVTGTVWATSAASRQLTEVVIKTGAVRTVNLAAVDSGLAGVAVDQATALVFVFTSDGLLVRITESTRAVKVIALGANGFGGGAVGVDQGRGEVWTAGYSSSAGATEAFGFSENGTQLAGPVTLGHDSVYAMAVDPHAGQVWVSDISAANQSEITGISEATASVDAGPYTGWKLPAALAADPATGTIWVADFVARTVTPITEQTTGTVIGASTPAGSYAYSVAADQGNGRVYVGGYRIGSHRDIATVTAFTPAAPAFTSPDRVSADAGAKVRFTITATGFPAPELALNGSLPGGLAPSSAGNGDVVIKGKPWRSDAGRTYKIKVRAGNGVGKPATQVLTIKITKAAGATVRPEPAVEPVGGAVPAVTVDQSSGLAWAAVSTGGPSDQVVEVSETSQAVLATIPVPAGADAIAVSPGASQGTGTVWVASAGGRQFVSELSESGSVLARLNLTKATAGARLVGIASDPVTARVFALAANGTLIAIPAAAPLTYQVIATGTARQAAALAVDPAEARIWVTDQKTGSVSAFSETGRPVTGLPARIATGTDPDSIAIDQYAKTVWVANTGSGTLTEIDAATGAVIVKAIKVGDGLTAVAVAADAARPSSGLVWTVTSDLPFTFDEFSEASRPAKLVASGPADPAGVPYAIAADTGNGQLYEGTSTGLSPFVPSPPELSLTTLYWWTNDPSADSAPATPQVFFPPPEFSMSGAPRWLTLNPVSGELQGQPPGTGTFSFTVTARDTLGLASSAGFTINAGVAPVFTSAPAVTFAAGIKSRYRIVATGVPTPTLRIPGPISLPHGLRFQRNGLLSGRPAAGTEGTYQYFVVATNDPTLAVNIVQYFVLTIRHGVAPKITSPAKVTVLAGRRAVITIRTRGFPAAHVTLAGRLPAGLKLTAGKPGTAVITGRPAGSDAHHHYKLTVTASNGIKPQATQTLLITVS